MLRKLVSKISRSLTSKVVSPRKDLAVPIRIWFEPDRATGPLRMPSENLYMMGETRDLSSSGVSFIVAAIRIQENYLVGGNRQLNAELDLPGGKIAMEIVGSRYEQVGEHISTARFLVGAKITRMTDANRENYEHFLRHGARAKRGSLALGIDEG